MPFCFHLTLYATLRRTGAATLRSSLGVGTFLASRFKIVVVAGLHLLALSVLGQRASSAEFTSPHGRTLFAGAAEILPMRKLKISCKNITDFSCLSSIFSKISAVF